MGETDDVFDLKCNHLRQGLKRKFDIHVEPEWQHLNGGVFVFDKSAKKFLNDWHETAQDILADKDWQTRDQSALIAVTWKQGLQHKQRLPIEFNLLADYNQTEMKYRSPFHFSLDNFETEINPKLIHVINHYGDRDWVVWRDIECLLS